MTSFIVDVVTPGTTLKTDGWTGYTPLQSLGFQHQVTVRPDSPDSAHVLMPGVHRIAALLKRGLLRTLQGRISKDHLLYYLDEFAFPFNRRSSRARGLLFYRLISQSVQTDHTSTHDLILYP